MSKTTLVGILLYLFSNIVLRAQTSPPSGPFIKKAPPAFFVFGDSLVDNGNNNFLLTPARADVPPYGIDHPFHLPTGRFSNGRNLPDLIGERIGLQPLLPYLDPKLHGKKLLKGANFASAGIGILNDTGFQFVNIIRMPTQLRYFKHYQRRVARLIGAAKTKKLISEALVLITCGGNDFVNNYYFVRYSLRSFQYTIPDYVRLLVTEYEKILMRLHKLGARKVIVTATGPIGCAPAIMAMRSGRNGECSTDLKNAADTFNPQVKAMTQLLNKKLGSDVFIFVDAHNVYMDFISRPKQFGFDEAHKACCGQGAYNGLGLCTVVSHLCPNRDKYVFWDGYHPTERAVRLFVKEMFSSTKHMTPMNLSTLIAIDSVKS